MAITIPNTFVAGTKIEATPMNANFAETANAVDKRGDTLTGNLGANAGITVDGIDLSTIPNTSGTFNPLFAQVVIGTADTNGIRLDLESGTLAVREGDDSAYGPLITSVVNLPSTGSINFASGDVTVTHSTNTLTFAGASSGYIFNDGNVGLGVTPSAWDSTRRVLQIGGSGSLWTNTSGNGFLFLLNNAYYDGTNYKYLHTDEASYYAQTTAGAHSFATAASGTAGNNVTFTERFHIDNSGNVGIGTSSPGSRLDVQTTAQSVANIVSSNAAGGYLNLGRSGANAIIGSYNAASGGGATINADALFFRNANGIGFGSGGAGVTAHLTSSGNFAIGAAAKLYLDGVAGTGDTYIYEVSANQIRVVAGGNNAASFASTYSEVFGDLYINPAKKFYLDGGGDTYIEEYAANEVRLTVGGAAHSAFNATGQFVYYNPPTTASAANAYIAQTDYIRRSTSSIRYKHDIDTLDTTDALSAVMAMRPVTYRGKTDEDQRRFVGFIAEEMAEIAPLLCTYDEGGESGTPNYVTYDRVTAYLVAVVKQQQTEINALKARIH